MFTEENRKELEETGVTVVPNVVSLEDCDRHQEYFREWLDNSFAPGRFPQSKNSLIQRYHSGHMPPAWEARLAAKPVFSQLWGTEKLLSSMDAIAIGRPPEDGQEEFWNPDQSWLHVDQTADRKGLHAYQGAVYLETIDEDDWTFEVIKGSHIHFDDFMKRTEQWKCFSLKPHHIEWFEKKGCERQRIPCPKGGMILWDSRLFHANARPLQGRNNPGRWRFVVFVSMAPAWWASPSDLLKKAEAYHKMYLTTHWPSEGIHTFSTQINKNQAWDRNPLDELPEVAKSEEAQRLIGILPYEDNDNDGNSEENNGSENKSVGMVVGAEAKFRPVWDTESWAVTIEEYKMKNPRGGGKGTSNSRKKPHRSK